MQPHLRHTGPNPSTLNVEATHISNYKTTRYYKPEAHNMNLLFFYYKLTVNVVVGWRGTCSSSDEVSDSESEPVAKNRLLLMFIYFVANTN